MTFRSAFPADHVPALLLNVERLSQFAAGTLLFLEGVFTLILVLDAVFHVVPGKIVVRYRPECV